MEAKGGKKNRHKRKTVKDKTEKKANEKLQ